MNIEELKSDFAYWCQTWKDDPGLNDSIYESFEKKVWETPHLVDHLNVIQSNKMGLMGFGEIPFRYLWLLLVNELPQNFKFLEIGIYKGSILALVNLCAKNLEKGCRIYGISPLDGHGDRYDTYDAADYMACIIYIHEILGLGMSNTKILKGLPTDSSIKDSILREGKFDMVYIDGSHNYEDVVSDIELSTELLSSGGFLVMDDASLNLHLGSRARFHGHADVARAVKDRLDSNQSYDHLFACGHNRVWRKK